MLIFPDKIRTDLTYIAPNERTYSFLNRSGLQEFGLVREKLNKWFEHYPESEQYELKKRMQSKDQFSDAFFELYMHEFFFNKGFHLSVHPVLEITSKQPDFWVEKEWVPNFYLEVKVVHDESDEERNYKKEQNKIVHELNKLANFPYWISIRQLKIKNESSFSIKQIIRKIQETAKTFDYLRMIEMTSKESMSFEDANIQMKLAFWPRSSSRIGWMNQPVGVHGFFKAGIVNISVSILKAVQEKAGKYGKLSHPFVIAINCTSPHHFSFYDLEILIGKDLQYTRSNQPMEEKVGTLSNEGIFSHHFMDQVAALFIIWVSPYHQNDEQWYWCENPNFKGKVFQESLINQIF